MGAMGLHNSEYSFFFRFFESTSVVYVKLKFGFNFFHVFVVVSIVFKRYIQSKNTCIFFRYIVRMPQTACMAAQSIRPSHMIARLSLRKVYNEVHNSKGIAIASTKSEDLVSRQN